MAQPLKPTHHILEARFKLASKPADVGFDDMRQSSVQPIEFDERESSNLNDTVRYRKGTPAHLEGG